MAIRARFVFMRAVVVVLAFSVLALFVAGCANSYNSEISAIAGEATLNNAGADGAPQQSVAAEWAIRDFAELLAKQNTEQAYLLYLLGALLALSFLANLIVAARLNKTNRALAEIRDIFLEASDSSSRPPG